MSEEHKKKIGISDAHDLIQTGTKWEQRKGRDTDYYFYDEKDAAGNVVGKYEVSESMSIYPPFGTTVNWEKLS
jgi:hypothetical protein